MSEADLLTIRDLAERWGVSIDKAKKHVRRCGVPFIRIGSPADMLVCWGSVRFRLVAVLQWEQDSEAAFREPEKPAVQYGGARSTGKYKHLKIR